MASDEFRSRSAAPAGSSDRSLEITAQARAVLDRRLRIVDVGAQLLGVGSNPYDPLVRHAPLEIIGFDPLK
jgi:hypothetical protein